MALRTLTIEEQAMQQNPETTTVAENKLAERRMGTN
jgi:hypothetical protein